MIVLLASIVCGFSSLFIGSRGVYHAACNTEAKIVTCSAQYDPLTKWQDGIYFSTVTLTTLGYGDYFPLTEQARRLVVGELASGSLVILTILPVLVSRLALFGDTGVDAPEENQIIETKWLRIQQDAVGQQENYDLVANLADARRLTQAGATSWLKKNPPGEYAYEALPDGDAWVVCVRRVSRK